MKKHIIKTSLVFALLPGFCLANDKDVMAYCSVIYTTGKHGVVGISSNHGISIINKSGKTQTYHVEFDNAVYYGKSRELPVTYGNSEIRVPNAHIEFDLHLETGKTFHYGPINNRKDAYFEKGGRYKIQATTIIKLNNVIVDDCTQYGMAEIY
jgi:hypothetical protein